MTTTLTAQRVAAGAAWLDQVHPGWERKIDLATLRLRKCEVCVLGQVVGSGWAFHDGMFANANACTTGYSLVYEVAEAANQSTADAWMTEHGFALEGPGFTGARWQALDNAWGLLIKERFDSGLLSDEVSA